MVLVLSGLVSGGGQSACQFLRFGTVESSGVCAVSEFLTSPQKPSVANFSASGALN